MTLTLSARPATTLLIGNRDSVRRGSGFVLVGYTAFCHLFSCLSTHKSVGPWQRADGHIMAGMEATSHEEKDEGQKEF